MNMYMEYREAPQPPRIVKKATREISIVLIRTETITMYSSHKPTAVGIRAKAFSGSMAHKEELTAHSTNRDQSLAVVGARVMRFLNQHTPMVMHIASSPTYLNKVAVGASPLPKVVIDSNGIRKAYNPRATSIGRKSSNISPTATATSSHLSEAIM